MNQQYAQEQEQRMQAEAIMNKQMSKYPNVYLIRRLCTTLELMGELQTKSSFNF